MANGGPQSRRVTRGSLFAFLTVLTLLGVADTAAARSDGATNTAGVRGDVRSFRRGFEVTIHSGSSAGLVVVGILNLDIDPHRGTFTGRITQATDKTTGAMLPTVLFTAGPSGPVPHPQITEIQVRGSLTGHAVNMILLDVGGPGKHIFGVGTTENDVGKNVENDPGSFGGPAIGPEPGDSGDWLGFAICVGVYQYTICASVNTRL